MSKQQHSFPGCSLLQFGIISLTLAASLRILPNRSQFFQYESLTLNCGEPGKSRQWRVKRNTSALINKECSTSLNRRNESHCSLPDLYPSDTGVYWCESRAGGCSDAVNITVTGEFKPRYLSWRFYGEKTLLTILLWILKCMLSTSSSVLYGKNSSIGCLVKSFKQPITTLSWQAPFCG